MKTDGIGPEEVAQQLHERLSGNGLQRIRIDVPGSPHDAMVGYDLSRLVPKAFRGNSANPSAVVVVSDQRVADQHAQPLMDALSSAGLSVSLHLVPSGESAKTLAV